MRKVYVKKGTNLRTDAGVLVVNDYNGSIYYCSEYVANDEGDLEPVDDRMLTRQEIAALMKEVDGLNRSIVWDGDEDE